MPIAPKVHVIPIMSQCWNLTQNLTMLTLVQITSQLMCKQSKLH